VAAAAPAGLQAGKTHKVSGGDTLWDLSGKYYQDPYKWGKIYNANLQVVENPDRIYPREELLIPDITEEVQPVRQPAAISGSDTFTEPGVSVSEVAQPAVTAAVAPRPAARAEDLFKDSDDQLSEEMPEHHKEWASGVKIVPEGWREDGVITAKLKNDDDFLGEALAVSGEMLQIAMSDPAAVKPGDYLAVYLKGAMAYDKAGQELGLEVQPAGLAEVVSVDGSVVKARVVEAVTAITKGFIVKKK
jgi:LysM repeat protein